MTQLLALLKPFSGRLVRPPAKGKFGDYVSHYVIAQRLLAVVGPYSWEITQTVRDANGTLTGCVGALTCTVDGREVRVSGSGDCENPGNCKTDGERLKLAESDAFKRSAMRLGVALHLWAGDDFYIYDLLKGSDADNAQSSRGKEPAASDGVDRPGFVATPAGLPAEADA
jgi:hypothetical protein